MPLLLPLRAVPAGQDCSKGKTGGHNGPGETAGASCPSKLAGGHITRQFWPGIEPFIGAY